MIGNAVVNAKKVDPAGNCNRNIDPVVPVVNLWMTAAEVLNPAARLQLLPVASE
jgi:hypothetical protein